MSEWKATQRDEAQEAGEETPRAASQEEQERPGEAADAETAPPDAAAVDEAAQAEAAADTGPGEGEDLLAALQHAREELGQAANKYMRLQAEFDNYKKRVAKEHSEAMRYALTPLVRDLTEVLDNLERAMAHARQEQGTSSLLEGIEMVVKQIGSVFEKYGVTRITAVGEAFDPTRHEAMNVVETEDVPENQVIEEFQAGYMLHERVVRPAMVSVAKRPQAVGQ